MNNNFLNSIKTNEVVVKLMTEKNIKATKTKKAQGNKSVVEFFIGEHRVTKMLIGPRGAVLVQVNTGIVELLTYLHKA